MKLSRPAPDSATTVGRSRAVEQRSHPRVSIPFPTTVEGVDVGGAHFRFQTVADNLSRGGIYFRLMPCVEAGTTLSVDLLLGTSPAEGAEARRVRADVVVLRVEEKSGGACGVAAKFLSPKLS